MDSKRARKRSTVETVDPASATLSRQLRIEPPELELRWSRVPTKYEQSEFRCQRFSRGQNRTIATLELFRL